MASLFVERSQSGERAMAELETRRGERRPDHIQYMELRAYPDALRQAFVGRTCREFGDLLRHTGIGHSRGAVLNSSRGRIHRIIPGRDRVGTVTRSAMTRQ